MTLNRFVLFSALCILATSTVLPYYIINPTSNLPSHYAKPQQRAYSKRVYRFQNIRPSSYIDQALTHLPPSEGFVLNKIIRHTYDGVAGTTYHPQLSARLSQGKGTYQHPHRENLNPHYIISSPFSDIYYLPPEARGSNPYRAYRHNQPLSYVAYGTPKLSRTVTPEP